MKLFLTIFSILFCFSASAQKSIESRVSELEQINYIREGNEAVYESQLLLIEAFKEYRHYGLTHFRFGYAHYMKIQIKIQEAKLSDMRINAIFGKVNY